MENLNDLKKTMVELLHKGISPHEIIDILNDSICDFEYTDIENPKWEYCQDILGALPTALDINYRSPLPHKEMVKGIDGLIDEMIDIYGIYIDKRITEVKKREASL